jgi:hypothetical protein
VFDGYYPILTVPGHIGMASIKCNEGNKQQEVSETVMCHLADKIICSGKNNGKLVERKFRSVIEFLPTNIHKAEYR